MATSWIGRQLGKYQVDALLGRGGMADVYRATQPSLARAVAIKVIHPHLAAAEGFIDRFQREARLVASLRHPNIVQVIDFDVESGVYYMVMEYIAGETLDARLRRLRAEGRRLPLDEVQRINAALCDAVDYAHQHAAVHRDLKPSNVMFTARDVPVLTDFGIAKIVGMTGLTMTGSVTGTPLYMSPEQAQGGAVDGRTDIYSLGVILYEMVAGQVPFDGDTPFSIIMKHVTQEPPPPRQFRPDVPELVQAVVLRALAKRPEERQQRALELAQAFAAAREAAGLERRPDATQVQPVVPVPVVPVPVVPVPADPSAPGAPATWPLPGDALAPSPASAAPTPGIAPPAALVPPPAAAAQAAAAAAAPAAAAPRRRSGATWLIAFSSLMVVVMIGALGLGFLRNRLPGGTAGQPPTAAGVAGTVAAVATQPGAAPSATPAAPAASPTAGGLVGLDTTETPPAPDGAPEGMVAIPAGPFVLGDERGRLDVRPVRSIDLSAFWIDRTEVTNAQFAAFVNATQHVTEAERQGSARNWREPLPGANALGRPQHPAIYISWDDAQAYCAWAGKRLPTNAEWEKAARGDGGLTWPWGNEFDPARLNQRVGEPAGPMPVGSFPSGQSPYGVLDMAGNVWEWGADYYAAAYYLIAPDTDPQGPAEGDERTLRGGGFANSFDAPPLLTIAFRDHAEPAFFDESSGFRCAQTPAQP